MWEGGFRPGPRCSGRGGWSPVGRPDDRNLQERASLRAETSSAPAARADPTPPDSRPQVSSGDAANTRMTLMELLKRAGEADVASLAEQLGISGVAVRQHLAALERDGKVAQRSVRRPVGRPAKLYRLTGAADQAFPQASARIALDLLARLEKLGVPKPSRSCFRRGSATCSSVQGAAQGSQVLGQKLKILAEIRESEGYLCNPSPRPPRRPGAACGWWSTIALSPTWRSSTPRCAGTSSLFQRLLGEPDLRRVDHIRSGGHACVYESPGRRSSGERLAAGGAPAIGAFDPPPRRRERATGSPPTPRRTAPPPRSSADSRRTRRRRLRPAGRRAPGRRSAGPC